MHYYQQSYFQACNIIIKFLYKDLQPLKQIKADISRH